MSVERELDLHECVRGLTEVLPQLRSVALFGSRRFGSGSRRSDVDLLLDFDAQAPGDRAVADAAGEVSAHLDPFVVRGDVAQSAITGSRIEAPRRTTLRAMLDAVEIWRRDRGFTEHGHRFQCVLDEPPPAAAESAPLGGKEDFKRKPIDYLVITALGDEFRAVQAALGSAAAAERSALMFTHHLEATIPHAAPYLDETVVVCQSDRMGNVASALTTAEALRVWRPRLAVLVGITGGVKGQAHIGDLIVATHVFDYEMAKATWRGLRPEGIKLSTSFSARQRLRSYPDLDSLVRRIAERTGVPPGSTVRHAAYASGEKVVASARRARAVYRNDRTIAAIEMEALGVGDACRRAGVEFMVMKAVVDLADRRKSDAVRLQGCAFAGELLVHMIRQRVLLPPRTTASDPGKATPAAATG